MKKFISKIRIRFTTFTVIIKKSDNSIFIGYINGKDLTTDLIQYMITEFSKNPKQVLIINKNKKLGLEI